MSRKFGLVLFALALAVRRLPAQAQNTTPKPSDRKGETFTFLCTADQGGSPNGGADGLRRLVSSINDAPVRPAFVVEIGSVTANGLPDEFARVKEAAAPLAAAKIGFYAVPGRRDVKRSPDAKEGFAQTFGKTYQAFDYNSYHFVLLDSTVAFQNQGHLDKAETDWLAKDLKKLKPETPVLVFLHHSVGRETPSRREIDNENDLFTLLRGHNVVALFTSDGGEPYQANGIEVVPGENGARTVSVSPILVTVTGPVGGDGQPTHVADIPVTSKARRSQLRVGWDDPDVPFLERRRVAATLEPRAINDNADTEKGDYRLDDGAWQAMTKDRRDIWRSVYPTKPIAIGVHTADARITTSNGVALTDELIFEVERDRDEPTRKWAINLDGPIQSSPVLLQNALVVSCLDGKVYALELEKGKRLWSFATKGTFLASPVLAQSLLYIGSTDHNLYALEPNGRKRWQFDAGGPVLSTVAVAQNIVCLPANGKIYGLNAENGKPAWTQPATGFFASRAVTDGSAFYLCDSGGTLYALDAATGAVRWQKSLGAPASNLPASNTPAVANGRVFAALQNGRVTAYNAQSGELIWTARGASTGSQLAGTVFADSNRVYLSGSDGDGTVAAFNATTGTPLWRVQTGQAILDSAPKLAPDGRSFAIMGFRGKVSVLDTATGRRLWSYELGPGNIYSTPEYDGKIVYTVTMANDVQALNGPGVTGSPLAPSLPKTTTRLNR